MEKLRVYCGGTLFSCSFWSSVLTKKKKKSCNPSDYIEWANRAVLCNCRCCHPPPELPLELLLWTLIMLIPLIFHFAIHLSLPADFIHLFPSYWLLFSLPLLLHFPIYPKLLCLLMNFPHSCLFSSTVPALFSLLDLTPLSFCSRVHPTSTERKYSCCLIPWSSPWQPPVPPRSHSQRTPSCWMELLMLWSHYCQRRGALTWTEFVQNKESGENSPDKLKPPSSLCKQRCFFRSTDNIWTACHKGSKRHCCLR